MKSPHVNRRDCRKWLKTCWVAGQCSGLSSRTTASPGLAVSQNIFQVWAALVINRTSLCKHMEKHRTWSCSSWTMEHPSKIKQEFSTEWWQLWTVQGPKTSREINYTAKCIHQERQERSCPWQEPWCQKPIWIFAHPGNNSQDHSVQLLKGGEFEQNARRCLLQTLLAQHNSLKPGSELKEEVP